MTYTPLFDPAPARADRRRARAASPGDRRDGAVYQYTEPIKLAVNVALATGRPLLVRGPSGSGKSTLAVSAARVLGWDFRDLVVTSRTRAQDLLWRVDQLQRLQDAQTEQLRPIGDYVMPGVLWWAFAPASAAAQERRVRRAAGEKPTPAVSKRGKAAAAPPARRTVVLLDEIDKADPDVPNNLLVPLGSLQFTVEETGETVSTTEQRAPLVILTTNEERELPNAFLRRCVELQVTSPGTPAQLADIGALHFPGAPRDRLVELATRVIGVNPGGAPTPSGRAAAAPVSTAEYLDTVRACDRLGVLSGRSHDRWDEIVDVTVWKQLLRPGAKPPG